MESLHSNFSLFFTSICIIPCWSLYIPVNSFSFFPSTTDCYSSKNSLFLIPDPSHFYVSGIGVSISLKSEVPTIVIHNCLKPRLLICVRIFSSWTLASSLRVFFYRFGVFQYCYHLNHVIGPFLDVFLFEDFPDALFYAPCLFTSDFHMGCPWGVVIFSFLPSFIQPRVCHPQCTY